jgi:hypothetical protein
MKVASKILGMMLVTTLMMASFAASAFAGTERAPSAGPVDHEAGCHRHGHAIPSGTPLHSSIPRSPRPAPVNYGCCLTGHDVAVVQTSDFPHPTAAYVCLFTEPMLTASSVGDMTLSLILSADPPDTTPLRI